MELTGIERKLIVKQKAVLEAIVLAEQALYKLNYLTPEQEKAYIALLLLKIEFGLDETN